MPSEPVRNLFDPDMTSATYRVAIDASASCLQELVNYSTGVLARCFRSVDRDAMHMAVLVPFRHSVELLDGIRVMLASGVDVACMPLLRAGLESLIGIEYILKDDVRRRAYARLYFEIRRRQHWLRYVVPESEERRRFEDARRDELWASDMEMPLIPNVEANLQALAAVLNQPDFRQAADEAKRVKKAKKHMPKWHELYGGPCTVFDLARHVGRGLQYEWLYRLWSESVHGADLSSSLIRVGPGVGAVRRIRAGDQVVQVANFAVYLGLSAARAVLLHYRSGEQEAHARWYNTEFKPLFDQVRA